MNLRLVKAMLIAHRVRPPIAAVVVARFDDLTWEPNPHRDAGKAIVGTEPAPQQVPRSA